MSIDRPGRVAAAPWLLAAALACITAGAGAEIRVITVKSRPAQEMLPLIQPLLAPGDYANARGYQLILDTSPANYARIEQLLARLDRPARMLTVSVRQASESEARALRQGLHGRTRAGDIELRAGGGPPGRGGATAGKDSLRYHIEQEQSRQHDRLGQSVRVLDGHRASIQLGQEVILSVPGGALVQGAASGFEVIPRLQGEHVVIEIAPRRTALVDPRTGATEFRQVATTVRARLGEWIEIGRIEERTQSSGRALLQGRTRETDGRSVVLLKVD